MTERKWIDTPWVACGGYTECDMVEDASGEIVAYDVASGDVAHLIAAAPDLYEALDRMVEIYDIGEMTDMPELDAALAALAKARGETT